MRPAVQRLTASLGFRPLSARSVLASVLIGSGEKWLHSTTLTRIACLLDVPEGTARVMLSRMVSIGQVSNEDGCYRLAGSLVAHQGRLVVTSWPEAGAWDRP